MIRLVSPDGRRAIEVYALGTPVVIEVHAFDHDPHSNRWTSRAVFTTTPSDLRPGGAFDGWVASEAGALGDFLGFVALGKRG